MKNNEKYNSIIEKYSKKVTDDELIELICEIASSGITHNFDFPVFNFASTGGPSSLTTLLVPLYLYSLGLNVINLAVPGRPAGAIDVLAQIKNYNLNLSIEDNVHNHQPFYLHLEANDTYVPRDKELFEYRKLMNKIDVPNLAIASLLAKNLAIGAQNFGLDVRVSAFGNFGKTWEECIINSETVCRISKKLGINTICFLSDANFPYQKHIGRGESLEAINDIFEGVFDEQLYSHNNYCQKIAKILFESSSLSYKNIREKSLQQAFSDNLAFQGSAFKNFIEAVRQVAGQPHKVINAKINGYVHFNLNNIRLFIVKNQGNTLINRFADACGITLLVNENDYVVKGTPILSLRVLDSKSIVEESLLFSISKNKIKKESKRREEIIYG